MKRRKDPEATIKRLRELLRRTWLLVEDALRALPSEQREVVYLKVYEGLTFREIGERCGVGANTAASRYRYALEALRSVLEPGGERR